MGELQMVLPRSSIFYRGMSCLSNARSPLHERMAPHLCSERPVPYLVMWFAVAVRRVGRMP